MSGEIVYFAKRGFFYNIWLFPFLGVLWGVSLSSIIGLTGCDGIALPTEQQLSEFQKAGPITYEIDVNQLVNLQLNLSEYQIASGDVLEIRIPRNLLFTSSQDTSVSLDASGALFVHVDEEGMITLPVVGRVPVQSKTITQIEADILSAYYPKYSIRRPTIFAKVSERKTAKVTIVGAVNRPGIYELPSDRMTLISAIMAAEGIVENGAGVIRVSLPGMPKTTPPPPPVVLGTSSVTEPPTFDTDLSKEKNQIDETKIQLVMPVKGMNIPFSDISLTEGSMVEVETLDQQVFTVMGLVNRPGVFPYPANSKYNLLQAIAFAGGVDDVANPRFVRVYRKTQDGEIVDAAFSLKDSIPTSASMLMLKPGDVVAVEETPRTHLNTMIAEIFAIRVGGIAGYNYNYNYYDGKDFRRTD